MDVNAVSSYQPSPSPINNTREPQEERTIKTVMDIIENYDKFSDEQKQQFPNIVKTILSNRADRWEALREALPKLTAEDRKHIRQVATNIHQLRADRRAKIRSGLGDQLSPADTDRSKNIAQIVQGNRADRLVAVREALPKLTDEDQDKIRQAASDIHELRADRRAEIGSRLSVTA